MYCDNLKIRDHGMRACVRVSTYVFYAYTVLPIFKKTTKLKITDQIQTNFLPKQVCAQRILAATALSKYQIAPIANNSKTPHKQTNKHGNKTRTPLQGQGLGDLEIWKFGNLEI